MCAAAAVPQQRRVRECIIQLRYVRVDKNFLHMIYRLSERCQRKGEQSSFTVHSVHLVLIIFEFFHHHRGFFLQLFRENGHTNGVM